MPFLRTPSEESLVAGESHILSSAKNSHHNLSVKSCVQSTPQLIVNDPATLTRAARLAPPSKWATLCHGRLDQIIRDGEGYVLENWRWPSQKIKNKVKATQFGRAAALVFPLALDDRIDILCRLCMILVLVDDVLDHLSFADGKAYNERLTTIMSGAQLPDPDISAETLLYTLCDEMRAQDPELAAQTLRGTFDWFAGMTEPDRHAHVTLGDYLDYRERDVGMAMLSAMVRYGMALRLTPSELAAIRPVEQNFVRQYCAVNDACSWDKELAAAQAGHREGARICSGVQVLADETGLPAPAAKRMLWALAREYGDAHDEMAAELEARGCSENVRLYLDGLRCLMAGNEEWCLTSARYNDDAPSLRGLA